MTNSRKDWKGVGGTIASEHAGLSLSEARYPKSSATWGGKPSLLPVGFLTKGSQVHSKRMVEYISCVVGIVHP